MSCTLRKRKQLRTELPWITTLLDKLPSYKLPTKGVVLRRLMFLIERGYPLSPASLTVKCAGYRDILHKPSNIVTAIRSLHRSYKTLIKVPTARREKNSFKKKEGLFLNSLTTLFDISVKSLKTYNLSRRPGLLPLGQAHLCTEAAVRGNLRSASASTTGDSTDVTPKRP